MNLTKDWYRSEFVDHEMIAGHRSLEKELSFTMLLPTAT